jgi:hypothetical protein
METCTNEVQVVMNSSSSISNGLKEEESADYFFHYTTEIVHLVSIMNNNFMPFYCMESIEFLDLKDSKLQGMAYPVVCFCDLPLSRHKEHKSKFGEYGIGMKKEWGINNLLTPIIYSHPRSMTAVSLRILIEMANQLQQNLTEEEFNKFRNSISILIMNYKAYEGKQYLKKEKKFADKTTRFYDEREWRYIPLEVNGLKWDLEISEYQNDDILAKENEIIQRNNRLKFNLNDVEYLFLKNDAEIEFFLSKLSPKYSNEDQEEIKKKIRYN